MKTSWDSQLVGTARSDYDHGTLLEILDVSTIPEDDENL